MRKSLFYTFIALILSLSYVGCNRNIHLQKEYSSIDAKLQESSNMQDNKIASPFSGGKSNIVDSTQFLNLKILPLHIDTTSLNKYDANGNKTGWWYLYSSVDGVCFISNYNNGKRDGFQYEYAGIVDYRKKKVIGSYLSVVTLYNNDEMIAWQAFDSNGMRMHYLSQFSKEELITEPRVFDTDEAIRFYMVNYYENGEIASEGWAGATDYGELLDHYWKSGEWKYYLPTGVVIRNHDVE